MAFLSVGSLLRSEQSILKVCSWRAFCTVQIMFDLFDLQIMFNVRNGLDVMFILVFLRFY